MVFTKQQVASFRRETDGRVKRKRGRPKGSKTLKGIRKDGLEGQFKLIQKNTLKILREKTKPEALRAMDVEDINKVLKACRENLHAIRIHKAMERDDKGQIEFVVKTELDKKEL